MLSPGLGLSGKFFKKFAATKRPPPGPDRGPFPVRRRLLRRGLRHALFQIPQLVLPALLRYIDGSLPIGELAPQGWLAALPQAGEQVPNRATIVNRAVVSRAVVNGALR